MAKIGNFGKLITFSVSDRKQLPFKNMKRSVSANFSEHAIIGKKPLLEFTGANPQELELEITVSATRGVKPRTMIDRINKFAEAGKADFLVIGGKRVAKNRFVIVKSSDDWEFVMNKGELVKATIKLTFKEYPKR